MFKSSSRSLLSAYLHAHTSYILCLTQSACGICSGLYHCCYLFSLLFQFSPCINIYSDCLREQFCYLFSNALYILSLQHDFKSKINYRISVQEKAQYAILSDSFKYIIRRKNLKFPTIQKYQGTY